MARRCRLSFILRFWNQTCGQRRGESRHLPPLSAWPPAPAPLQGRCGRRGSAGERRPAPASPPRGTCHHVQRDQLNPCKNLQGDPEEQPFHGAYFPLCLLGLVLLTPRPWVPASLAALPHCCPFASTATWDCCYGVYFMRKCFGKGKETRSATGFLFPPPRAGRDLD